MTRVQWKSRRTFGLIAVFVLYLIFRVRNYDYNASVFLPKINPLEAWEFVADFSNMRYLNPTIVDFNILDESGNYKHWKYSAEYRENLSHWPYSSNIAVANFDVKSVREHGFYLIHSTHRTCFLAGLYCHVDELMSKKDIKKLNYKKCPELGPLLVDSESDFKFTENKTKNGVTCEEKITYQCPAFMSYFCRREVEYQRRTIMNNLYRKFTGKTATPGQIHLL